MTKQSGLTGLDAGRTQAGYATRRLGNFVQQLGTELRLRTPARRLRDTGGALDLNGALVGLTAQRAKFG